MQTIERFRGCLLGLAVGDAVGTTLEFKPPGSFTPITRHGRRRAVPAESWPMDRRHFDGPVPGGQPHRMPGFRRARPNAALRQMVARGYCPAPATASTSATTTADALAAFERTGSPYSGPTEPNTAGNGSLMRLAPVPLFFAKPPGASSGPATAPEPPMARKPPLTPAATSPASSSAPSTAQIKRPYCARHCPVPHYWDQHPLHPASKLSPKAPSRRNSLPRSEEPATS